MQDSPANPAAREDELDVLYDRALTLAADGSLDRDRIVAMLAQDSGADRESILRIVDLAEDVTRATCGTGAAPTPLVPGYEIIGVIGRGGMGTVYRARRVRTPGEVFALKVLPAYLASTHARLRFRREARAIARLRHDHVISIHDVVEIEGGALAIVLDLVEGSSLAEVIDFAARARRADRSAPTSASMSPAASLFARVSADPVVGGYERWVARVGLQIARALAHVHEATLVHRDVKPSNILLKPDGEAMLADFGIARDNRVTEITVTGEMVGTPLYAAPEQLSAAERSSAGASAEDDDACDPRTDVYSLGATLYHALALRPPHAQPTPAAMLASIREGLAPSMRSLAANVPRDLESVVAKAMEPLRAARYQSAADLADDLERFLDGVRVSARPVGRIRGAGRLIRRNRRTMAGATIGSAVSLLVVSALSFYLFVAPSLARRHLDRSYLSLMTFEDSYTLYNLLLWDLRHEGPPSANLASLSQALEGFTRASWLRPFDNDILMRRDVLVAARSLVTPPDRGIAVPPRVIEQAPVTAAFIREWSEAARIPPAWDDHDQRRRMLESMTKIDRAALGLAAFIGGAPHVTVAAWDSPEVVDEEDPLIDALMGILRLIEGQPARAYPRLRAAHERYPQSAFVAINLAQAAAECGDVAESERWFAAAVASGEVPVRSRVRVSLLIDIEAGRWDEVDRALTAQIPSKPSWTSVSAYQIAMALERRGRTEEALLVASSALGTPIISNHARALIDLGERWWAKSTPSQRRATLIKTLSALPHSGLIPRPDRCWENVLFWSPGCDSLIEPRVDATSQPASRHHSGPFARVVSAVRLDNRESYWRSLSPGEIERAVDDILERHSSFDQAASPHALP